MTPAVLADAERRLFYDATGACRVRPATVIRYQRQLRAVLNFARDTGLVADPVRMTIAKEVNRPFTALTAAELKAALKEAEAYTLQPALRPFLLLRAFTGRSNWRA